MTGAARIEVIRLPGCVYPPVVIPAKAGIQEGEAGMVNRPQPQKSIPADAGMDCLNHWIPACAGMTGVVARIEMTGLPECIYPPIVIPAKAGIQEGRPGWETNPSPKRAFPLCGNGLLKPLDSGLRRNDRGAKVKMTGLPECIYPPAVIPAKAGIQEGGGRVMNRLQP